MIKMPISEIADRLSICRLKQERTSEDLREEIKLYENEVGKYIDPFLGITGLAAKLYLDKYIDQLYKINGEIWQLEADIRKGREKELGLKEVGRRAIKIRDLNKQRIAIKNKIVELTGEGFKDIKVNHASGDK